MQAHHREPGPGLGWRCFVMHVVRCELGGMYCMLCAALKPPNGHPG